MKRCRSGERIRWDRVKPGRKPDEFQVTVEKEYRDLCAEPKDASVDIS